MEQLVAPSPAETESTLEDHYLMSILEAIVAATDTQPLVVELDSDMREIPHSSLRSIEMKLTIACAALAQVEPLPWVRITLRQLWHSETQQWSRQAYITFDAS